MQIYVSEKSFGKEQIKVKIDKLNGNVPVATFGDPVAGTTGYAICLYDESNTRIAALRVNRAQAQCGTRPCWKAISGPGFKYSDKLSSADGVVQVLVKAGVASNGKMLGKGKNNLAKGLTALPTGVAQQLTGDRSATVQFMTSNAGCLTGKVTNVREASGLVFKGTTP